MSLENLQLIVIQPTSFCNLNCKYCYVPFRQNKEVMSDEILEMTIKKVLDYKQKGAIEFLYHSGEPLSSGLDFFNKAITFIEKYRSTEVSITNNIQTNATLVNKKWIEFFKSNNFRIGVSIDGPQFLHDKNRVNWAEHGSYKKTMEGYNKLKINNLRPSVLTVLTDAHLEYPTELFNFYLENSISNVGLITEEINNQNFTTSLVDYKNKPSIEKYSSFIEHIFNMWLRFKDKIYIREISDLISYIEAKKKDSNFSFRPIDTKGLEILTIQKDGNITTFCPEFAGIKSTKYNDFIIGNIMDINNLHDLAYNSNFQLIEKTIAKRRNKCKKTCEFFDFCGSAYNASIFTETGDLRETQSIKCLLEKQALTDVIVSKIEAMSSK